MPGRLLLKILKYLAAAVLLLVLAAVFWLPRMDRYQTTGKLKLTALREPVTVHRDEYGIPYIYANSLDDAITAQGFVVAQHRLFQMEIYRQVALGRLAEMIGERGLDSDRLSRLLGFTAMARRQIDLLSDEEINFFQRYIDGVNAYIRDYRDEHPVMLRVVGRIPEPWTLRDIIALQLFQVWSSSVNWQQELVNQQVLDRLGAEKAAGLLPLNYNPDDPATASAAAPYGGIPLALRHDGRLMLDPGPFAMGSNVWASGSRKSANGAPILANDPHIDTRNLPGIWHPMGLITPELRAVGGAFPGSPGLGNARTAHIAWGATNGYADMIDLFVETVDPGNADNYLEGDRSIPFVVRQEVLRIRDSSADGGFREQALTVRETRRGPVISDHGMTTADGRVISLRWSVPEMLSSEWGIRRLMLAQSVEEVAAALSFMPTPLNYVAVDATGSIARISTGYTPLRLEGDGSLPMPVGERDSWGGRIPWDEMPRQLNPARDWVAAANSRVTRADYPYPYSTYAAASWRYRRLIELFEKDDVTSEDHWDFTLDIKNPMAELVLPHLLPALQEDSGLREVAGILAEWDLMDATEQSAPAIFQRLYHNFAWRVFVDELGEELALDYLKGHYQWQENLVRRIEDNGSAWFDDVTTPGVETRDDLFRLAAHDAIEELASRFGDDPRRWRWGDIHTVTFFHPLVPGEWGARLLGGGVNPMAGSGETLNRAIAAFDDPEHAKIIDSTRIVMDLSDPDKIEGHIPGGVSERLFDRHQQDSLPLWLQGKPGYWWFSDEAIREHTVATCTLVP
jgi:penicillin amidase